MVAAVRQRLMAKRLMAKERRHSSSKQRFIGFSFVIRTFLDSLLPTAASEVKKEGMTQDPCLDIAMLSM
jgi:hypothetical protein